MDFMVTLNNNNSMYAFDIDMDSQPQINFYDNEIINGEAA